MRTQTVLLLALPLTACATSTRFVDAPQPTAMIAPEPGEAGPALLSMDARRQMLEHFLASYEKRDGELGGPRRIHSTGTELAMLGAARGVGSCAAMAQRTLLRGLQQIDKTWGGAYDVGAAGEQLKSVSYEKTLLHQAESLRLYAMASAMWGAPEYLEAARAIDRYIERFLTSPSGALYAGQAESVADLQPDEYFRLDDANRRKLGVPKVDARILTRDNGRAIVALTTFYDVSGDEAALERAVRAADWLIDHRRAREGGFLKTDDHGMGLELADTLSMAEAMLALYASTGDWRWLAEAEETAQFAIKTFTDEAGGGFRSTVAPMLEEDDDRDPDENVRMARFSNLLDRYTGRAMYRSAAEHALRYLSSPELSERHGLIPGVLIADGEFRRAPVHVIVIGDRNDPRAQQIHAAVLAHPTNYRVVEWVEPGPAPFRYSYVRYPRPRQAAAIACADGDCTPPAYELAEVHASLKQLARQ